ncbi:MAG TPA: PepSY domain-containing protein [Burkholderiales bacterium]
MSPRLHFLRLLRRWHARIGFIAAAFFILLAVTGVVANHGDALGLDGARVHSEWLDHWYGIALEPPRAAFRAGSHELVAANGRWMLDARPAGDERPQPLGFVELGDMLVVACAGSLYVLRADGRLVDRLEGRALPAVPIESVGTEGGELLLRTRSGTFASADVMSWQSARHADVSWSAPVALSDDERERYGAQLAPGIPMQRLLLDVHSGRIAGRYGPLAVDAIALVLVALAASGAWMFASHRRRR